MECESNSRLAKDGERRTETTWVKQWESREVLDPTDLQVSNFAGIDQEATELRKPFTWWMLCYYGAFENWIVDCYEYLGELGIVVDPDSDEHCVDVDDMPAEKQYELWVKMRNDLRSKTIGVRE